MKHARKLASLLLALVMVFALATTAFAQDVGTDAAGKGTITISNAAKGETYHVYKLFDATVSDDGKAINYTGEIPTALGAYFTKDTAGNITTTAAAKDGDNMSEGLKKALTDWVADSSTTAPNIAVSDGSTLNFKGLEYGYYVITSTQGNTNTISVDSTMPNVTIVDKNVTIPYGLTKTADKTDVNIGDTVTYTVKFKTANYDGTKQIISYTITDTLPEFLSNVNVTSITIKQADEDDIFYKVNGAAPQFDPDTKSITIPWGGNGTSLYENGAEIVITYTAVVTDKAVIDGAGNANIVTISWTKSDGSTPGSMMTTETIFTYAIALKKVNEKGEALSGAVFQLPFYVKESADTTDKAYIYAGTAPGEGLTDQLTTPQDGVITIKGVKTGTYSIEEVAAPNGYNKLTAPVTVTATPTNKTTTNTTFYLDKNGNVVETKTDTTVEVKYDNEKLAATPILVVNKAGVELPSTGGTGTTIFYVLGSILVIGAAVLLVTKKRMSNANR